jgi:hypothetical protein
MRAALLETLRGALATDDVRSAGERPVPTEVAFESLLEKGRRRRKSGLHLLAVSAYVQAIKLRPGSVEALLDCGSTLDDMGDRVRAVAILGKVLQLDPGNVEALCRRGRARLLDGDEIGARTDSESASAAEPDHPMPPAMLGLLSHLHGDLEGAAERYRETQERAWPRMEAGGARGRRWPYLAENLVWCNLRFIEGAEAGESKMPGDPSSSPLPPSPLLSRERERLVADVNFDGAADLMLSDSVSTFGTGGGRFTVWLGSPDGSYERVGSFFANSGAVSVEKVGPGLVAVHTYSHMNAGSGHVSSYLLAENGLVLVRRRMIYPGTEEGSKEYRRLFEKRVGKREVSTTEGDTVSWAPWH